MSPEETEKAAAGELRKMCERALWNEAISDLDLLKIGRLVAVFSAAREINREAAAAVTVAFGLSEAQRSAP